MKNACMMFPPFVDAYHIHYQDAPVSLIQFKKEMLSHCFDWESDAIKELLFNDVIQSKSDLKDVPIYIGWWGKKHYGVFCEIVDDNLAFPVVKEFDYPFSWNRT